MRRQIPPLTALRAFEAAARHLSFTKAAEELNLTPSAISHQVKALEDFLGASLFRRLHRSLALTDVGRAYLPPLTEAFDRIHGATAEVLGRLYDGPLTVTMVPTFAIRWLVPRLGHFQAQHPDIEVRLMTGVELVDFEHSSVDAAIRYGNGDWPNVRKTLLMREELVPVCSPALLENGAPLKTPSDLKHFTLLHDLHRPDEWRMWLTAAGAKDVDPDRGPKFQGSALALQAAIEGLGVVIIYPPLAEQDLESGRLVIPLDFQLPVRSGYYLLYPEDRADDPRIKAFERWLLSEVPKMTEEQATMKRQLETRISLNID
ncbi:MAG: transcriptional regulator GcvA [Minwuiales bacterium]|nr:transcriptional regulator GcvA [Minwuiales bacterium]